MAASYSSKPVQERLYSEPYAFEFFQAVRLMRRIADDSGVIDPRADFIRFRSLATLNFPPSAVYDLEPARVFQPPEVQEEFQRPPRMAVAFLGLHGPSGVLPRHYTELLMRLTREARGEERYALREWLDLFNHRFITLFYKAWEHYRFVPAFERGDYERSEPDPFTLALFCLIGNGTKGLRKRIRVVSPAQGEWPERVLRSVDDLSLLRFAGILSQRFRNAWGLQSLLSAYFQTDIEIRQFRGQWLPLEEGNQSQFHDNGNCSLGQNTVAGDRIWDVQGKFLIRIGPLNYDQFIEFLPDTHHDPSRKAMFLLSQLVRLYCGPELDADIQLVLRADDVPQCELTDDLVTGPRLGWNCWTLSGPATRDADDAMFDAVPLVRLPA